MIHTEVYLLAKVRVKALICLRSRTVSFSLLLLRPHQFAFPALLEPDIDSLHLSGDEQRPRRQPLDQEVPFVSEAGHFHLDVVAEVRLPNVEVGATHGRLAFHVRGVREVEERCVMKYRFILCLTFVMGLADERHGV